MKQKKEPVSTIIKKVMPLVEAYTEDKYHQEEAELYLYFSEYAHQDSSIEERVGTVQIDSRRWNKKVLVEYRNNNGEIRIDSYPYDETMMLLKEQKERNMKLYIDTGNLLRSLSEKVFQETVLTPEKVLLLKEINKICNIMEEFPANIEELPQNSTLGLPSYEVLASIEECNQQLQQFMNKYQIIPPTKKDPSEKTLEEIINLENATLEDIEYLMKIRNHLLETSKKTNKKEKYSIFIELPIHQKLAISYNEFLLERIMYTDFTVSKKVYHGTAVTHFFTEQKQAMKRKQNKTLEKVLAKEELSREELLDFLFSIDWYIDTNSTEFVNPYLLEETEDKLEALTILEIKHKEDKSLIQEKKNKIKTWKTMQEIIIKSPKELGRYLLNESYQLKNEQLSLIDDYLSKDTQKEKNNITRQQNGEYKFKRKVIDTGKQLIEEGIINAADNLNCLSFLTQNLQDIDMLTEGLQVAEAFESMETIKTRADMYTCKSVISAYFTTTQKILKQDTLFYPTYIKLQQALKKKADAFEQLAPKEFCQRIQEDKVNLPKQLVKQ